MSWIIFGGLAVIFIIAGVVCFVIESKEEPHDYESFAGFLVNVFTILLCIVAVCLVIMGLREWGSSYDAAKCESWGEAAEREVKYQMTAYWDGSCLVKTDEGWISKSNLYVDEGGKIRVGP
jgi:uncharacterized membrane protein